MSLPISMGRDWSDWVEENDSGTLTISGGVATLGSTNSSTKGVLAKYVPLRPGETLRFSVIARRISGTDDGGPGVAIDYPSGGTNVNQVLLYSEDWQEYSLSYTAPLTGSDTSYVKIVVGSWYSRVGTGEFCMPRAEITSPAYGAPRLVAQGLLLISSGTPTYNANFAWNGIKDLAYDGTAPGITVTVDAFPDGVRSAPIFLTQLDNYSYPEIAARHGGFDRGTGELTVKFTNTTTGVWVDPATLGDMYLWFSAWA